jgi:hypothetical protein
MAKSSTHKLDIQVDGKYRLGKALDTRRSAGMSDPHLSLQHPSLIFVSLR